MEQDVFFTVGNRINLFQGIVGRLQPILSRLPLQFEELALLDKDARAAARQRFIAKLDQKVTDAKERGFDIDATVEGSLDLPSLPVPALTLSNLDRAIQIARAPIRITTDVGVFEFSSGNVQLFSPVGGAFSAFNVDRVCGAAEGKGIAWLVQRPGAALVEEI